jgi:hypothetical protein
MFGRTWPILLLTGAFFMTPASAGDTAVEMAPFIKSGLKLNYGSVTQISGNCPMVVITTNSWKTEYTTFTIDWAKITSVNYRQNDNRRVDFGGEYFAKSDKSRNGMKGNGFVMDVQTPAEAKKMLMVLRDVRKGCGGYAGPDEVG